MWSTIFIHTCCKEENLFHIVRCNNAKGSPRKNVCISLFISFILGKYVTHCDLIATLKIQISIFFFAKYVANRNEFTMAPQLITYII